MYNGKSMHIGLRHRQVNQLINDGVITISFLRSSKNLADPFTKGLTRKLIEISGEAKVHHPNVTRSSTNLIIIPGYGNILDNVHLSEWGSEAASYELKGLVLKHSEKPRYRPKAGLNGSAQSGLNEREEGYATFDPDFEMYLVKGDRKGLIREYPIIYNLDEDPQIYSEAMKSHDSSFWKEAVNDEMDSIIGNNTWILVDLPHGSKSIKSKWIFKRKLRVDGCIKKFKARTPFEVGSKLTYNTSRILAQNKYAKVIGSLITIYYGLEYNKDPSVLEGCTYASWITDQEDYASTSGWIFTLGGVAVSWGSKKQSCLTDSTMEAEFVALASCCKEAEWLRDLLKKYPYGRNLCR
nr:zinc finger, CCHC-type [Tanacetum cinerariifolium]